MPTVTRFYITACVLTTLGVQLDLLSPFQLYFNYKLIFIHHQYWRLITTFLFFGTISFTFMFNIMFTYRYSRMLEEGSFRSNSADFFFMLLFGAILMIIIAPFVKLLFLGHAFTIMLVYIWAKRNTHIQLSLFGLFNFRAPHLPWILLGFSLILGNSILTDVMGILVGHVYYYLQDVFPYLPGGFRCLKTPKLIVYLFNPSEYYMERINGQTVQPNAEESRNQATNQAANQSEATTNSQPMNSQSNDQTNDQLNSQNNNQANNQANNNSNDERNNDNSSNNKLNQMTNESKSKVTSEHQPDSNLHNGQEGTSNKVENSNETTDGTSNNETSDSASNQNNQVRQRLTAKYVQN